MLCSWWICPFYCFPLHYCGASHFNLRNYTFVAYFDRECEASHSQKNVICRKYPLCELCMRSILSKPPKSNPGIARARNLLQKKGVLTYM